MSAAPGQRPLKTLGVLSLAAMLLGCAAALRPEAGPRGASIGWQASLAGAALGLLTGLLVRGRGWTVVLVVPSLTYLVVVLTT